MLPLGLMLLALDGLKPARPEETNTVGLTYAEEADEPITATGLMRTLLAVNVCVILGYVLHAQISALGVTLPLFVPCLVAGIALGNLLPLVAPGLPPIRRTPALALFLAFSLMSLKLWALARDEPARSARAQGGGMRQSRLMSSRRVVAKLDRSAEFMGRAKLPTPAWPLEGS